MKVFVPHDFDGFFGLFVDNMVQLLLIIGLCTGLCGMSGEDARFIYQHILPGAAVSILIGNLFYAIQAHMVARREHRDDVTALPFGINTPSLLVFVFFVMVPAYQETKSAEIAWKMGLLACLGSGVIELLGSFVGETIRRHTPRAALLSTLAGIAIGFISMTFALQIWSKPLVAMVPMAIVLLTYFGGIRFPLSIPGGLVAVLVGSAVAWTLPSTWTGISLDVTSVQTAWNARQLSLPIWSGEAIWQLLQTPAQWARFLSVIIPMGLFNVVGSLQNIESAEAAGDRFATAPSMAVNGISTIAAALFGSCFPTTIYIGHPGWKGLGARAGYSTLNGIVITALCFTGTVAVVSAAIPLASGIAIVLWIGIIITAQAFQATPTRQAPAAAIGLFPAIAAWGATVVYGAFTIAGGTTMQAILAQNIDTEVNGFLLHGLVVLERGFIFTCMILSAIAAFLIDQKFFSAAFWSVLAALGTFLGLMHTYQISGNVVDYLLLGTTPAAEVVSFRGTFIAAGYLAMGVVFLLVAWRQGAATDDVERIEHA
jgi:AGZA family xanthine/uracil permease-like MFS transporter